MDSSEDGRARAKAVLGEIVSLHYIIVMLGCGVAEAGKVSRAREQGWNAFWINRDYSASPGAGL